MKMESSAAWELPGARQLLTVEGEASIKDAPALGDRFKVPIPWEDHRNVEVMVVELSSSGYEGEVVRWRAETVLGRAHNTGKEPE